VDWRAGAASFNLPSDPFPYLRLPPPQGVQDVTAREDLVASLRLHLLLRVAAQRGCGTCLCGDSATTLAARVVATAARGGGLALPTEVHAVDGR
jgi:hypothetical protein